MQVPVLRPSETVEYERREKEERQRRKRFNRIRKEAARKRRAHERAKRERAAKELEERERKLKERRRKQQEMIANSRKRVLKKKRTVRAKPKFQVLAAEPDEAKSTPPTARAKAAAAKRARAPRRVPAPTGEGDGVPAAVPRLAGRKFRAAATASNGVAKAASARTHTSSTPVEPEAPRPNSARPAIETCESPTQVQRRERRKGAARKPVFRASQSLLASLDRQADAIFDAVSAADVTSSARAFPGASMLEGPLSAAVSAAKTRESSVFDSVAIGNSIKEYFAEAGVTKPKPAAAWPRPQAKQGWLASTGKVQTKSGGDDQDIQMSIRDSAFFKSAGTSFAPPRRRRAATAAVASQRPVHPILQKSGASRQDAQPGPSSGPRQNPILQASQSPTARVSKRAPVVASRASRPGAAGSIRASRKRTTRKGTNFSTALQSIYEDDFVEDLSPPEDDVPVKPASATPETAASAKTPAKRPAGQAPARVPTSSEPEITESLDFNKAFGIPRARVAFGVPEEDSKDKGGESNSSDRTPDPEPKHEEQGKLRPLTPSRQCIVNMCGKVRCSARGYCVEHHQMFVFTPTSPQSRVFFGGSVTSKSGKRSTRPPSTAVSKPTTDPASAQTVAARRKRPSASQWAAPAQKSAATKPLENQPSRPSASQWGRSTAGDTSTFRSGIRRPSASQWGPTTTSSDTRSTKPATKRPSASQWGTSGGEIGTDKPAIKRPSATQWGQRATNTTKIANTTKTVKSALKRPSTYSQKPILSYGGAAKKSAAAKTAKKKVKFTFRPRPEPSFSTTPTHKPKSARRTKRTYGALAAQREKNINLRGKSRGGEAAGSGIRRSVQALDLSVETNRLQESIMRLEERLKKIAIRQEERKNGAASAAQAQAAAPSTLPTEPAANGVAPVVVRTAVPPQMAYPPQYHTVVMQPSGYPYPYPNPGHGPYGPPPGVAYNYGPAFVRPGWGATAPAPMVAPVSAPAVPTAPVASQARTFGYARPQPATRVARKKAPLGYRKRDRTSKLSRKRR